MQTKWNAERDFMLTQSCDAVILRFRKNGREIRRYYSTKPILDDDGQIVSFFAPCQRALLEAQRLTNIINEVGLRGLSRDDRYTLSLPEVEDTPQDEVMPQVGYLEFPPGVPSEYAAALANQREADLIRGLCQTSKRQRDQRHYQADHCLLDEPEDSRELCEANL